MLEMRIFKRISLLLVVSAALVLVFAGCSGSGTSGKINSPQDVNTLTSNNLTVEYVDETYENGTGSYVKISGLKDEKVEAAINNTIYNKFCEMRDADGKLPYRGVQLEITDDYSVESMGIFATCTANFNNILSVQLSKSTSYQNGSDELGCKNTSDSDALNFDLNTGKQITLAQVFCDDVDYKDFLDRYVEQASYRYADSENNYTYEGGDVIRLTSSFDGISDDQKFYINWRTNSINLIFDYNTPEIYCDNFSPIELSVELGDNSALASRFYDENTSLFTDETTVSKLLLEKPFDESEAVFKSDTINVDASAAGLDELSIQTQVAYYNDMDSAVLKFIKDRLDPPKEGLNEYLEALSSAVEKYGKDDVVTDAFYTVTCNRFGSYTNVSANLNWNIYTNSGTDDSLNNDAYSETVCFKDGSSEPMKFEDVFADSSNIKDVVVNAFKATVKETESDGTLRALTEDELNALEEVYNKVADQISGFELTAESMVLTYDDDPFEMIEKIFSDEDDMWKYNISFGYVNYTCFGCENLNIF